METEPERRTCGQKAATSDYGCTEMATVTKSITEWWRDNGQDIRDQKAAAKPRVEHCKETVGQGQMKRETPTERGRSGQAATKQPTRRAKQWLDTGQSDGGG